MAPLRQLSGAAVRRAARVSGVYVAEYVTELPPREALEGRLHRATEAARNRLVLGAGVDAGQTRVSKSKRKGQK